MGRPEEDGFRRAAVAEFRGVRASDRQEAGSFIQRYEIIVARWDVIDQRARAIRLPYPRAGHTEILKEKGSACERTIRSLVLRSFTSTLEHWRDDRVELGIEPLDAR